MASRHQANAKNHERRVCQALGGQRNGPNPGSDCVGTPWSVECKRMTKLSLRQDHIDQAKRQSEVDGKEWILVLQEHGDEAYAVMPFQTFINIAIKAGDIPLVLNEKQKEKVDSLIKRREDGCWEWSGYKDSTGYGRIEINKKRWAAHRVTYMAYTGFPIPAGLDLEHLCRKRDCVNPEHLEPVTRSENVKRGDMWQKNVTHCPKGHPYDEGNTRHYNGKRICRTCSRASTLRWWRENRQ